MRICRKCSKQISDDIKICRDCGAILEELQDDSLPPVVVEPGTLFEFTDTAPANDVDLAQAIESSVPEGAGPSWECPHCAVTLPGTFDACWKCLTTRDDREAAPADLDCFGEDSGNDRLEPGTDSDGIQTGPLRVKAEESERSEKVCPRCQSSEIMHGVTVRDQGQGSGGTLQVVVYGNPSALVFKDRLQGELKSNICANCGHVDLYVTNPRELYRHHRESLDT